MPYAYIAAIFVSLAAYPVKNHSPCLKGDEGHINNNYCSSGA